MNADFALDPNAREISLIAHEGTCLLDASPSFRQFSPFVGAGTCIASAKGPGFRLAFLRAPAPIASGPTRAAGKFWAWKAWGVQRERREGGITRGVSPTASVRQG